MQLISSLLRDTVARETNFVVERHLRCLTAHFRGARFDPRTSVLHPFWFIFGGDLIFIVRKLVGGWEASNFSEKLVLFLHRSPSHVFLTRKLMLTTPGKLSLALNPIFVLYTPGRPPICIGRPVIVLDPFEPL